VSGEIESLTTSFVKAAPALPGSGTCRRRIPFSGPKPRVIPEQLALGQKVDEEEPRETA
jgi:hypothetical protein